MMRSGKCLDAVDPSYSIDAASSPNTGEVLVRFRLVVLAVALLFVPELSHSAFAQNAGRGNAGRGNAAPAPARPTPRLADGSVNWGSPIGEKGGLWNVAGGTFAI